MRIYSERFVSDEKFGTGFQKGMAEQAFPPDKALRLSSMRNAAVQHVTHNSLTFCFVPPRFREMHPMRAVMS